MVESSVLFPDVSIPCLEENGISTTAWLDSQRLHRHNSSRLEFHMWSCGNAMEGAGCRATSQRTAETQLMRNSNWRIRRRELRSFDGYQDVQTNVITAVETVTEDSSEERSVRTIAGMTISPESWLTEPSTSKEKDWSTGIFFRVIRIEATDRWTDALENCQYGSQSIWTSRRVCNLGGCSYNLLRRHGRRKIRTSTSRSWAR